MPLMRLVNLRLTLVAPLFGSKARRVFPLMSLTSIACPSQASPPSGLPSGPCTSSNLKVMPARLPDRQPGHAERYAEHGRVGRDVERAPVVVAEPHVGRMPRDLDAPEQLAVGREHLDAGGAGAVNVALPAHLTSAGDAARRPA